MKSNIISLHKKIYQNTKKRAYGLFVKPNPLLRKYQRDQSRYARRPFRHCGISTLIKTISKSHFIYLGDFHTFDQNSRNLERIIRALLSDQREPVLALEMVYGHHQSFIDAFLSNDLTELEFLESINYHESWRFPWNHYKVLFDLARENQIKIFALNSFGDLKSRDEYASERLLHLRSQYPDCPVLVLFGELHIVPDKIPRLVEKKAKAKGLGPLNSTIIHQNLDEVYWKEENINNQEKIVRFGPSEFSLQTSPPWIKYESLVYWFENLCEDPDFDIHEYLIETGIKTFSSNAHSNFLYICKEIFHSLRTTEIPTDNEMEDFNIYDHSKLKFVASKIAELEEKPLCDFYTYLLTTGQSFKIPYTREYYCASYSLNRLSYLVGNHIFGLINSAKGESLEKILTKRQNQAQKFLTLLQLTMVSFLSSKIINPHRKCDLYRDLFNKLQRKDTSKQDKKYIKSALAIIDSKGDLQEIFLRAPLKTYYEVAKIVGHFLCEKLYEMITLNKEVISEDFLNRLLFSNGLDEESFLNYKKILLPDRKYKETRKRFF